MILMSICQTLIPNCKTAMREVLHFFNNSPGSFLNSTAESASCFIIIASLAQGTCSPPSTTYKCTKALQHPLTPQKNALKITSYRVMFLYYVLYFFGGRIETLCAPFMEAFCDFCDLMSLLSLLHLTALTLSKMSKALHTTAGS